MRPDAGAQRVLAWWAARHPAVRVSVAATGLTLLTTGILLIAVSAQVNFEYAYEILLGLRTPFSHTDGQPTVWTAPLLGMVGYVLVPTAIGSAAGIAIERSIHRSSAPERPSLFERTIQQTSNEVPPRLEPSATVHVLQDLYEQSDDRRQFVEMLLEYLKTNSESTLGDLALWRRANKMWFAEVRTFLLESLENGSDLTSDVQVAEQKAMETMVILMQAARISAEH